MWHSFPLWLIPIGFIVGTFGTMIGAGGGFILAPLLLLIYPHEDPDTITAISLSVTFANSFSGTSAYARMKRIHYKSGIWFAVASLPGAIFGSMATHYVNRHLFDTIFGVMLLSMAIFLVAKPIGRHSEHEQDTVQMSPRMMALGCFLSTGVGFLSSFLGIGGGIIHVPLMVGLLGFPVHWATATSHFVLAIMTGAGTATHFFAGDYAVGWHRAVMLIVGVLPGAQLGARLSKYVHGRMIIRSLGLALGLVGARILFA